MGGNGSIVSTSTAVLHISWGGSDSRDVLCTSLELCNRTKLGRARINFGKGEVSDEEEEAKSDKNAKVPPRVAVGVLKRQADVSVAIDVGFAGDCPSDGTSLILNGDPLIPGARGNKRRTGATQGAKFVRQDRFVRVSDRLCMICEQRQLATMKERDLTLMYMIHRKAPIISGTGIWYPV